MTLFTTSNMNKISSLLTKENIDKIIKIIKSLITFYKDIKKSEFENNINNYNNDTKQSSSNNNQCLTDIEDNNNQDINKQEQPTTIVEPTIVEPTIVEPTIVEPTITIVEPTIVEPTIVEPTTIVEQPITIVEPTITIVEQPITIVEQPITIVEPTNNNIIDNINKNKKKKKEFVIVEIYDDRNIPYKVYINNKFKFFNIIESITNLVIVEPIRFNEIYIELNNNVFVNNKYKYKMKISTNSYIHWS
jgi:hypothetical protein